MPISICPCDDIDDASLAFQARKLSGTTYISIKCFISYMMIGRRRFDIEERRGDDDCRLSAIIFLRGNIFT